MGFQLPTSTGQKSANFERTTNNCPRNLQQDPLNGGEHSLVHAQKTSLVHAHGTSLLHAFETLKQQTTNNKTTNNKQQTTNNKQTNKQTNNNKQQTNNNKQQTTNNKQQQRCVCTDESPKTRCVYRWVRFVCADEAFGVCVQMSQICVRRWVPSLLPPQPPP